MTRVSAAEKESKRDEVLALLAGRPLVLIGMMGAGKTTVGRRLAVRLRRHFADSDEEVEKAANMTIPEIFAAHGEADFRAGEARVIARLLRDGGIVLGTGGGAFISPETRALIKASAVSVWIRADFELLFARVSRRSNRPLLATADPRATLKALIDTRYPIYGEADVTVRSKDVPQDNVASDIIDAVIGHLKSPNAEPTMPDSPRQIVHVPLGVRSYDIVIGENLLESAGERLRAMFPGRRFGIVTDTEVARAQLPRLIASLDCAGLQHATITVPNGEASKSFARLGEVVEAILAAKLERGDLVIALGGRAPGHRQDRNLAP